MIERILTGSTVGVSEFKKNPIDIITKYGDEPVAVLSNNKPKIYCMSKRVFERMLEEIEDLQLAQIAVERENDGNPRVRVDF